MATLFRKKAEMESKLHQFFTTELIHPNITWVFHWNTGLLVQPDFLVLLLGLRFPYAPVYERLNRLVLTTREEEYQQADYFLLLRHATGLDQGRLYHEKKRKSFQGAEMLAQVAALCPITIHKTCPPTRPYEMLFQNAAFMKTVFSYLDYTEPAAFQFRRVCVSWYYWWTCSKWLQYDFLTQSSPVLDMMLISTVYAMDEHDRMFREHEKMEICEGLQREVAVAPPPKPWFNVEADEVFLIADSSCSMSVSMCASI